jgi:hypothetical protein
MVLCVSVFMFWVADGKTEDSGKEWQLSVHHLLSVHFFLYSVTIISLCNTESLVLVIETECFRWGRNSILRVCYISVT